MKNFLLNSVFLIIVILSFDLYSQSNEMKGYRIDGNEVVFKFDRRDYKEVSKNNFGEAVDFKDLNISTVAVSGEFNSWSMHKWHMKKIDENIFELRKKVSDFSNEFIWEFKFVINNDYWAEPSNKDINITEATKDGYSLNRYNLKFYTTNINENGNATFKLDGFQNAKNVMLSGSFNKWDENAFKMKKINGSWTITLQLKPDKYEYKFIVDGNWITDPNNPSKSKNEFSGHNSVLDIKKNVSFILNGYKNAKQIILTGSFNNWSTSQFKMLRTSTGWTYNIDLSRGKYHYKYIIDDKWIVDPFNTTQEYDYSGNINSVCIVK